MFFVVVKRIFVFGVAAVVVDFGVGGSEVGVSVGSESVGRVEVGEERWRWNCMMSSTRKCVGGGEGEEMT